MKTTRCTPCGAEFTDDEIAGATSCPTCGGKAIPMAIKNDCQVTINTHEIRILTIWASRWAEQNGDESMLRSLGGITHRLRQQLPGVALTLGEELQKLADTSGATVQSVEGELHSVYTPRPKN